jgi:hypothetical protein
MEGLMTRLTVVRDDDACMSADDARHLLYDLACDAAVVRAALAAMPSHDDQSEVLTGIDNLLRRMKGEAEAAAGGPLFDRLNDLERRNAGAA